MPTLSGLVSDPKPALLFPKLIGKWAETFKGKNVMKIGWGEFQPTQKQMKNKKITQGSDMMTHAKLLFRKNMGGKGCEEGA